jgi:hypothetical protein
VLQAERARNGIVTVVSTLALAHEEARTALLSSENLTIALISRLNHLTGILWEDDPRTMSSNGLIDTTSRALSRTLFVFHYLLFASHPQPPLDLKRKIRAAPPSAAIDHMFNVTFGRLSFALDLKSAPEEADKVLSRAASSSELSIKNVRCRVRQLIESTLPLKTWLGIYYNLWWICRKMRI